jgi:hypothetical protein
VAKAERQYTASSDWGTPNPRDPGAYPEPATTSMVQWAWEFLRRRDDYRRVWQKLVQPYVDGDRLNMAVAGRDNLDVLRRALQEGRPFHRRPPWDALRDEYKVFSNPVSATPHNCTLDPRLGLPPWFEGIGVSVVVADSSGIVPASKVVVELDLAVPDAPQVEGVLYALAAARRGARQPIVRMRVDKFPQYLRLLDFQEAGTSDDVIAEHLFPDASGEKLHDLIRKSFASARQWQNNHWRIALHPDAT